MSTERRMQADDFFDAYKALEEHGNNVSLTTMGPAVVNLAFAVELYIKDLYYTINIDPPSGHNGHNILKLYKGLPRPIRREIFAHDKISQNPFMTRRPVYLLKRFSGVSSDYFGFVKKLEAISQAFVEWRYSYEDKYGTLNYDSSFALAFIEAVKSATDRRRSRPAA